jgi:DNA-binding NtrC family response regulator
MRSDSREARLDGRAGRGRACEPASAVVVSRRPELHRRLLSLFADGSVEVVRAASIDTAVERFEDSDHSVLVVTGESLEREGVDGQELLDLIGARSPRTQMLLLVEAKRTRLALGAVRAGGCQYAKFPLSDEELRMLVETAAERAQQGPPGGQGTAGGRSWRFQEIVGRSAAMQDVYRQIRLAAATDVPVLLLGETGTGKDLASRAVHELSGRSGGPYVAVNLGALPAELVADALFGHEKGAFTGASERQEGRFRQAEGGTIFLDEIGTVSRQVQVTLLRIIDQKQLYRLGGKRPVSARARLIAACNQDLADMVGTGQFREDLYYRLDVFRISLPPLRERTGDVPLLVDVFLKRYSKSFGKRIRGVAPECLGLLESYDWPGNVRELKNVVQRAALVCQGDTIMPAHLPARFRAGPRQRPPVKFPVGASLAEVEREMIVRTLSAVGNNRTRAAELLGVSRRALYNKLHRHGIQ